MYFAADHLIEKTSTFNRSIKNNIKNLDDKNIFIFGIKPTSPSNEYGYFLTKKIKWNSCGCCFRLGFGCNNF